MKTTLPVLVISFRGYAAPTAEALADLIAAKWEVRRVHLPNGKSYVHAAHAIKQTSSWDLPYLVKFAKDCRGDEILLINRASSFVNQTGVSLETFLALPAFTA